ncbi:MAG: phage tail family protein, partial [Clostridia bacterium]|nr:phage tail family protein [Clostridia bacterium]
MRTGFSFKGIHSSSFQGMTVKTKDRPITPEMKEETYSSANQNSEHSSARANPYGHEYYNDRIFQIELSVASDNIDDLQNKIAKLSRWIMGSGELIFDTAPLVKWNARIIDTVQYMPERGGKKAVFMVKYRVKPFAELVFSTIDGPCLDEDIELKSDMPIGIDEYFTFSNKASFDVNNIGDTPVRPVITVTGASSAYSIECNGFTITVPEDAIIDCERYIVTDLSGNSLMSQVTGDFIE